MAEVERVEKVDFFIYGVDRGGDWVIRGLGPRTGSNAYPTYLLYPLHGICCFRPRKEARKALQAGQRVPLSDRQPLPRRHAGAETGATRDEADRKALESRSPADASAEPAGSQPEPALRGVR